MHATTPETRPADVPLDIGEAKERASCWLSSRGLARRDSAELRLILVTKARKVP
jgi:hypothetical protein